MFLKYKKCRLTCYIPAEILINGNEVKATDTCFRAFGFTKGPFIVVVASATPTDVTVKNVYQK
jgi:hypothetical protein